MRSIQCGFISDVFWDEPERSPDQFVVTSNIDIWGTVISSNLDLINRFENVLSADEQARASRYHQEKDKQRFIISRIVLRKLLAKYSRQSPEEIRFFEGLNKKPFIQEPDSLELHYNTSHSGNVILIAIADSEVGADIEKIDHHFSYKDILQQNFSGDEINFIKNAEDFYMLWTRKEALLKATAKGIDNDLPFIPSLDGIHDIDPETLGSEKNWEVHSFQIEKNYIGSVAYRSGKHALKFYEIGPSFL